MTVSKKQSSLTLMALALILLMAFALRMNGMDRLSGMLSTDEAYDSDFGLSLLAQPRLVPFWDSHLGEESGFHYFLAASLLLGVRPFSVRFACIVMGLLTVAAVYRLGGQLFDRRAGLYAALAIGVLLLHIIASQLVLRGILFPMIGCLAFVFLFQAMRTGRLRHWVLTGILFGLMVYTYYAQAPWLALAVAIQAAWLIKDRASRWRNALALGLTALIATPLAIHLWQNWGFASQHLSGVGTFSPGEIVQNMVSWVYAWMYRGSAGLHDNPPYRPILDVPLALVFYPGLLALVVDRKKPWPGLFVLALTLASIAPSLLSIEAPSYFRAVGVAVPIGLIAGAGAAFIVQRLKFLRSLAPVLPVVLLLWSGVNSYRATHHWLDNRNMYTLGEQHITTATRYVADHLPADKPIFFSPFDVDHPNVVFAAAWLAPRPVGGFKADSCIVIPDRTTTYFSLTDYDLDFQQQLARWSDIQPITGDPRAPLPWALFDATPNNALQAAWQTGDPFAFGDRIALRVMQPIADHLTPGSSTELWIGAAALKPLAVDYHVFVHLYGHPSPYEGGPIWAQSDAELCASYPPDRWRPGERVLTRLELSLPGDLPAGRYTVVSGVYDLDTAARLPVTQPPAGGDHVTLKEVSIP